MRMHLRYLRYICRHKWFVFVAGLHTRAPLWRLIIHDWSKFSRSEWGPYARRFFSGRAGVLDTASDPEEFHRAWTHHWHTNPHHWEYWLALRDRELKPMHMPGYFVREMVADWCGAGRAITGRWDVGRWYNQNGAEMILHDDTRQYVEFILARLPRQIYWGTPK